MSKKKVEWLDRQLLRTSNCFCLCTTEEQFHAALKDIDIPVTQYPTFLDGDNADATVWTFAAHTAANGKDKIEEVMIVCVSVDNASPIEIAAILVHEAVHIWQHTAEAIGESNPSKEMEAYAIQSISTQLFSAYARSLI